MLKTEYFWTDRDQANERLAGSFVLYNDCPVYIHEIRSRRGDPSAITTKYPAGVAEEISLSDKGFHRFRVPLPIGWVNNTHTKQAYFLERRPIRSRQHGFSRNNILVKEIAMHRGLALLPSGEISFETIAKDVQYQAAVTGNYPDIAEVLNRIRAGTTIAFCNTMAVGRDDLGLRWLYVEQDRVGLFVDNDTLLLIDRFSYLKEQIAETPAFKISNIKEF